MWLDRIGTSLETGPEGALEGTPREVYARHAEAAIRAGLVVQRGSAADQVAPLAAVPAAVANAIITAIAPVVAGQDLVDVAGAPGVILDGATGPLRPAGPARSMRFVADAHANWGLAAMGGTWCYFKGLDSRMKLQVEEFFLPAGGGVTIDSESAFAVPIGVYIGACDGAGGGAGTLGWAPARSVLGRGDHGIAAYERAKQPSTVAAVTFDATQGLDVVVDGTVWCVVEATIALDVLAGDPVAVRAVAAGADVRGQLTRFTSPGGGDHVLLEGAQWLTAAAAGGLALLRIGG